MRILQTNFHRGWGGQPSRILMMSRAMAGMGHAVTIAAPRDSLLAQRAREAGLPTAEEVAFRPTSRLVSSWRDVGALARALRAGRYDVVDAHGSQDLWACVAARLVAGVAVPLVFTRHNTKRVRTHAANRWLYRRQVDHLILASASVLDRYRPFLERGALDRDRISVIPSAYRLDRFHPAVDGGRIRAALGLASGAPLVGVIGRLVEDKGQEYLLRAAPHVLASVPEARFVLVGTGRREAHLRSTAAALGLGERVRFLGFRDDVPEITAALDVSVLPSVDCDASSAVLKEALACGVPVVATSVGGAGEIVRDGETGFIVPPRDPRRLAEAILDLLRDRERARAMGRRGSEDVAGRFTPARLAEATVAVYRDTATRFRASRGGLSAPPPGGSVPSSAY